MTAMSRQSERLRLLVRLQCPRHEVDGWLMVQDLPAPPPSVDVVTQAIRARFACIAGTARDVQVVAVFSAPQVVSWASLAADPSPPRSAAGDDGSGAAAGAEAVGDDRAPHPGVSGRWGRPGQRHGPRVLPGDPWDRIDDGAAPLDPSGVADDVRRWQVVRRADGRRLVVFRFQPFESRRGIDAVIGLRFAYNPSLIEDFKTLLRQWRPAVRRAVPHAAFAGGWLPEHRCWFVEEPAWPAVADLLRGYGFPVPARV